MQKRTEINILSVLFLGSLIFLLLAEDFLSLVQKLGSTFDKGVNRAALCTHFENLCVAGSGNNDKCLGLDCNACTCTAAEYFLFNLSGNITAAGSETEGYL